MSWEPGTRVQSNKTVAVREVPACWNHIFISLTLFSPPKHFLTKQEQAFPFLRHRYTEAPSLLATRTEKKRPFPTLTHVDHGGHDCVEKALLPSPTPGSSTREGLIPSSLLINYMVGQPVVPATKPDFIVKTLRIERTCISFWRLTVTWCHNCSAH